MASGIIRDRHLDERFSLMSGSNREILDEWRAGNFEHFSRSFRQELFAALTDTANEHIPYAHPRGPFSLKAVWNRFLPVLQAPAAANPVFSDSLVKVGSVLTKHCRNHDAVKQCGVLHVDFEVDAIQREVN